MFRLDRKKENCVKKNWFSIVFRFPMSHGTPCRDSKSHGTPCRDSRHGVSSYTSRARLFDVLERQACFDNTKGEAMDRGTAVVKSKSCILHAIDHAMGMSEVNVSHALPRAKSFVRQVLS